MYCPLGHGMHGEHPFEKGVHRPDFQKPSTQSAGHGLQMSQPVSSSSPKKNPLSHVHAPQSHKSSLIFPSRRAPAVLNKRLSPFRGAAIETLSKCQASSEPRARTPVSRRVARL